MGVQQAPYAYPERILHPKILWLVEKAKQVVHGVVFLGLRGRPQVKHGFHAHGDKELPAVLKGGVCRRGAPKDAACIGAIGASHDGSTVSSP